MENKVWGVFFLAPAAHQFLEGTVSVPEKKTKKQHVEKQHLARGIAALIRKTGWASESPALPWQRQRKKCWAAGLNTVIAQVSCCAARLQPELEENTKKKKRKKSREARHFQSRHRISNKPDFSTVLKNKEFRRNEICSLPKSSYSLRSRVGWNLERNGCQRRNPKELLQTEVAEG